MPILNVYENIVLPVELDGDTVDQKFMADVVSMLGLEDKLKNMPNNLSGGQQQRVAIARALVSKPAIVLADEPTGNLDSRTSADVLGLLQRTSREFNQTLVMITHALAGVGYIFIPKISSYMLAGSTLSWFVLMPAIALFGADAQAIFPGTDPIAQMAPSDLWGTYIKYIGAGAVATGGVISLIKSLPLIAKTFKQAMQSMKKKSSASALRTEQDIPMPFLLVMILVIGIAIWLVPAFPVNPIGALIVIVFGFFFATVSSRMVGLIGSSNNPVSGMAIATLLIATLLLKATGTTGVKGMTGATLTFVELIGNRILTSW